ncbi:MAG: NAD-dependent epimerase/dehydratase family protein [Candidatus Hodarchaeales archaeon]
MSRILAITGGSGYLAKSLMNYLNSREDRIFDEYITLDIRETEYPEGLPVTFYKVDVREDFSKILKDHSVTDVLHMAWILSPTHNRKMAYSVDIQGTKNVLKMVEKSDIEYLLHTSSTLAYGAHPDNPYPLKETDFLRGNKGFHYSYHKMIAEEIISDFKLEHPDLAIGVVRPSAILSFELDNYVADILRCGWRTMFMMPYPNAETPIQFLHLFDAIQGFILILEKRLAGIYNLTPIKDVKLGDIPSILNERGIKLPLRLLKFMVAIQWMLRLSRAPPSYLDFVAYPFVASNDKLRNFGFTPQYSTRETILSVKYGDPQPTW